MSKAQQNNSPQFLCEDEQDVFIASQTYPDAVAIFQAEYESIANIKDECLFVLDTNVLLVPFSTKSESLEVIRTTYAELVKQKRLFIPGHVAREFAKLRAKKLSELFDAISKLRDGTQSLDIGPYPLLESDVGYMKAKEQQEEINHKIREFRDALGKVLDTMRNWTWNDPVSKIYKELFDKDVVLDIEMDEEAIKKKVEYLKLHKLPPGYKDYTKKENNAGDLLIWQTILDLAVNKNQHLVFVSGEKKPDWCYRSNKKALYERFELVDEYRRASEGKSFHIIDFADLLKLFGAKNEIVEDVRKQQIELSIPYSGPIYKITRVKNWIESYFYNAEYIPDELCPHWQWQSPVGRNFAMSVVTSSNLTDAIANQSILISQGYDSVVIIFVVEDEEASYVLWRKPFMQRFPDDRVIVGYIRDQVFVPVSIPDFFN